MSNGLTFEIRYIIFRKWPLQNLKEIGKELAEKLPRIMLISSNLTASIVVIF